MRKLILSLPMVLTFLTTALAQSKDEEKPDELPAKIEKSVERAVNYLKDRVNKDFIEQAHSGDNAGVGALIGWALLECGASATDPAVKRAAEQVRRHAIRTPRTYSIAFAIIFLDRLGDKHDEVLIQSLAVRLLEGQYRTGGWTYLSRPTETAEHLTELKQLTSYYELLGKGDADKAKDVQLQLQRDLTRRAIAVNSTPFQALKLIETDNSNTQVAALALWVARRHNVPVDRALQLAELRFRTTQQPNGRWGYDYADPNYGQSLSMSCSGLIVIALGRATIPQLDLPKNLAGDVGVRRAFAAVDGFMKAGLPKLGLADFNQFTENGKVYYSLWSLERTCVLYNVDKVAGNDWYEWGARYLVDNQAEIGSWPGYYDRLHAADTCFALLFLKRANPAKDLATKIKSTKPGEKIDFFAPLEKKRSQSRLTPRPDLLPEPVWRRAAIAENKRWQSEEAAFYPLRLCVSFS